MAPKPSEEKPSTPVLDTYVPPVANRHTVQNNESWVKIAQAQTPPLDAWDLIDFNFPGTKLTKQSDFQRASRQVNWYLREYMGCQTASLDRQSWAFTFPLPGGRGAHKGGVIFLPPADFGFPSATLDGCAIIQIPRLGLGVVGAGVISALGIRLPTQARCLAKIEVDAARNVYGGSLNYDDIYVADSVGAEGRPFTVALQIDGDWIVVLNTGPTAFRTPNAHPSTLIHQLAHAWQSQHHPDPQQYMRNCLQSQAAAAAAKVAATNSTVRTVIGVVGGIHGVNVPLPSPNRGPASAYAYVTGKPFGDYGGEQTAEQVEDSVSAIREHMKKVARGMDDPENIRSLSRIKYEHKNDSNVVWSP